MTVQENIPLAPFTTLQVGGPARFFISAQSEPQVAEALHFAAERDLPLLVLGGGSNLLISDQGWPGLVLKIALSAVRTATSGAHVLFSAAAGENWDDLVALSVSRNCAGIECMSGIPGTVGGTPVQNVGAYGQEVSHSITSVRVLDIENGSLQHLTNRECHFGYRSSIFNTDQRGRYIVLEVTYRLLAGGAPALEYADLKKAFDAASRPPSLSDVRQAVRRIRQSKAMLLTPGDDECRSAGSFFKNPVLTSEEAARISELASQRLPDAKLPEFPADAGRVKLSAAWLVEQSGFHKGFTRGAVGISRKHALAIVNRGGATAREIVALKDEVQKRVFDLWGVFLQPEPVLVGFETPEASAVPLRS